METEEWRTVPDSGGCKVSSLGRFFSAQYREVRPPRVGPGGYPVVRWSFNGKPHMIALHTLVATAFHGPRPHDKICRHLDDDKLNAKADNLRWGTHLENVEDRRRNGILVGWAARSPAEACPRGHKFTEENTYRSKNQRHCRACRRNNEAKRLPRKRVRRKSAH